MRVLVLGLYSEGSTDERFLSPLLRRTTEELLAQDGGGNAWDEAIIVPINVSSEQHTHREQSILAAAEKAQGCHLLIVHADADGPTPERALAERFQPGLMLVKQTSKNSCRDLLPIISVQEVEAWLLADKQALFTELNMNPNPQNARVLGIPPLHHIENTARPKEQLDRIIRVANTARGREISRQDLYEPLGEAVRLDQLAKLSAYRQFTADLTAALADLGILSR